MTEHHAKKTFMHRAKIPLFIMMGWLAVGLGLSYIDFNIYMTIFGGVSFWIVALAVYGITAWSRVEDHNEKLGDVVRTMALVGVLVGVFSAIIGFIMIQTNPYLLSFTMQQIAEMGVSLSQEQMQSQMQIGAYIGFISGPIVNAGIAALCSALGAFVAKKKWIKI
jgi:uncharacterized membrane protein YfcA